MPGNLGMTAASPVMPEKLVVLEKDPDVPVTDTLRTRSPQGYPVEGRVCLGSLQQPSLSSAQGPSL